MNIKVRSRDFLCNEEDITFNIERLCVFHAAVTWLYGRCLWELVSLKFYGLRKRQNPKEDI